MESEMNNSTGKGIAVAGLALSVAYLMVNGKDLSDVIYSGILFGFVIVGFLRML